MGSLNMNMNMNMNMAASASSVGGGWTKVRFNTQDYRKYVPAGPFIPATFGAMRFPAYWDADLRAYEYLNEFLIDHPDWRVKLTAAAPADLTSPHQLTSGQLTTQVQEILDLAPDREDRFLEIIDQHDAEGSISYFLGMLMIDPSRMPATNLLIRVARRIGEHVAMCLKGEFRCPRPSQLCSSIVPMIDPPATPAFPSGHSLQAKLIATCLKAASPPMTPIALLDYLANRIGENRIIAGLHYPKDDVVGQGVGAWCYTGLLNAQGKTPKFKKLVDEAEKELKNDWAALPA